MNILKGSQPYKVSTVNVMFYGQPGVGKTSLGFQTKDPLLLDFDKGAYRSNFRKDIVQIGNWKEVSRISPDDLQGYDTVIIDTAGRALDYLAAHLIAEDPKLAMRSGALTLQGYGALKAAFATWIKTLNTLGKDIVLIAHDKEDKEGDVKYVRPDIQGGSYNEITKIADCIGYIYKQNKDTMLDFNPCEKWIGKNTGKFLPIKIPDFNKEPNYLANLLCEMKKRMNNTEAAQQAATDFVKNQIPVIEKLETVLGLNDYKSWLLAEKIDKALKIQVAKILTDHAAAIGCKYDSEALVYYKVEPIAPVDDTDYAAMFDQKVA